MELLERTDAPAGSAWGLFGADDELGAVNFLSPERVLAGTRCVRRGAVFSLDYPLDAFMPSPTRPPARHSIVEMGPGWRDDYLDSFYLQQTSPGRWVASCRASGVRLLRRHQRGPTRARR